MRNTSPQTAQAVKRNCLSLLIAFASALSILLSTAAASENPVIDSHAEAQIACEQCHGQNKPFAAPEMESCFECHESYEAIAKRTSKLTPNPHESHKGDVECASCHSSHGRGKLMCNNCHGFNQFTLR